jgi:hypothetical protein
MKGSFVGKNRFLKVGRIAGVLLMIAAAPKASHAQAAVYGEFSVSDLHNLVTTDFLYGATTGVLIDGRTFHHILLSGDLQGRFVRKNGESLNGITVGPRVSRPLKHGFVPYAEFMIGFARYNDPARQDSTTDATMQINGGVSKQLTPRFDVVADYSYSQYYALGGQFNPKTYSIGTIFHFVKR